MARELLALTNRRRVRIAVGISLLIVITGIVLVQSFVSARANDKANLIDDSDNYVQDNDRIAPDVITSTQDFERTIDDYIEAHILSDEERRAMGLPEVNQIDSVDNPGDNPDG
jgi:hypothetical protein